MAFTSVTSMMDIDRTEKNGKNVAGQGKQKKKHRGRLGY